MSRITPFYEHDGITIFCGDCLKVTPQLRGIDAIVSDPPYGMNWNTDSTRFTGGRRSKRKRGDGRNDWGDVIGDKTQFDPLPWLQFSKVILWGYNHFANLLPKGTILVWVKRAVHLFGTFLSDAEIAWMKGGHGIYCFQKQFPPPSRMKEGNGKVLHPNQKPISLMTWCFKKAKIDAGMTILDPYMGSGTTLVAAQREGCRAVGIEINEDYCKIAVDHLRQRSLWQIATFERASASE